MHKTITKQEFAANSALAMEQALHDPVFVTQDGVPELVCMSLAAFRALLYREPGMIEDLWMPEAAGIPFEPDAESNVADAA